MQSLSPIGASFHPPFPGDVRSPIHRTTPLHLDVHGVVCLGCVIPGCMDPHGSSCSHAPPHLSFSTTRASGSGSATSLPPKRGATAPSRPSPPHEEGASGPRGRPLSSLSPPIQRGATANAGVDGGYPQRAHRHFVRHDVSQST